MTDGMRTDTEMQKDDGHGRYITERNVVGFADSHPTTSTNVTRERQSDSKGDKPKIGDRVRMLSSRVATIEKVLDLQNKTVRVSGPKGNGTEIITVRVPRGARKTSDYKFWQAN